MATFAVLALAPGAGSAQWRTDDRVIGAVEPVDTATAFAPALPGQPPEPRAMLPVEAQQRIARHSPTPFIVGGTAIGAFGGGVVGYATCIAGDGDCSAVWRTAAGTAMGAFLGAVFWLATAVQP